MKKILLIIYCILLLTGCVKTTTTDSIPPSLFSFKPANIIFLSADLDSRPFSRCIQNKIRISLPHLTIIPEDTFRDNLYPWFESSTVPRGAEELASVLNNPLLVEPLKNSKADTLIYINGNTDHHNEQGGIIGGGGYGGAAFFGAYSADRVTNITTTIFNLDNGSILGNTDVTSEGVVGGAIFVIIPIPALAFTESKACNQTAKQLIDYFKKNNQL